MPIETICQGCARKLRVPDEHAGKKARCPQCGMIYVVPGSVDARSPSPVENQQFFQETAYARQWDAVQPPQDAEQQGPDRWQVRTPDGRVYGPVPRAELDQWYAEGRIPAAAQLRRESATQWQTAAEIYPGLSGRRRGISEQHNPFAERATPAGTPNPFASPSTRHQLPHRGGVILTLAILGWALCPVFGPFAWAMGQSDMRAMRTGAMDPAGVPLTQAGMVLGIIQTVLLLLGLCLVCFGAFG